MINHEIAVMLADLFGDSCACNVCGIDEWLPDYCEFSRTICPNTTGVACWEQFVKYYPKWKEKKIFNKESLNMIANLLEKNDNHELNLEEAEALYSVYKICEERLGIKDCKIEQEIDAVDCKRCLCRDDCDIKYNYNQLDCIRRIRIYMNKMGDINE